MHETATVGDVFCLICLSCLALACKCACPVSGLLSLTRNGPQPHSLVEDHEEQRKVSQHILESFIRSPLNQSMKTLSTNLFCEVLLPPKSLKLRVGILTHSTHQNTQNSTRCFARKRHLGPTGWAWKEADRS